MRDGGEGVREKHRLHSLYCRSRSRSYSHSHSQSSRHALTHFSLLYTIFFFRLSKAGRVGGWMEEVARPDQPLYIHCNERKL